MSTWPTDIHRTANATVAPSTTRGAGARVQSYRSAERRLWEHYGSVPTEHFLDLARPGVRVRVLEVGNGPPVLFVHGGPNAGSTFAPLVAAMAGRRCLILERPGCGLSGPVDYDAMPIPQLAVEVLGATLDGLGVDRIDLVGSSFGGAWAMWFALAHPERVRRLVLLGAPAFVPGMAVPPFMKIMLTPVIGALIARMPPSVRGSKWIYRQLGHSTSAVESAIPRVYWEWSVRLMADTTTMASDVLAIHKALTRRGTRPELEFTPDQLRSITAPTLLYWGGADTFGGADVARRTAELIPDCAVEIVSGAGHLPWLDSPGHAATAILKFLDEAAGPDTSASAGGSSSAKASTER